MTTTEAIKKAIEEAEADLQAQRILLNPEGIQGYNEVLALLKRTLLILDEYNIY